MMVRKSFILFVTLLFTGSARIAFGQSAYINTQNGIFQLTGGAGNCDRVLVSNGCDNENSMLSIAIYKDTFYYNTWSGQLKRFKIGVPGSCETLVNGGVVCNAMTADKNGMLYMANQNLFKYDPYTHQLSNLGPMPFRSMGDLAFYKDKLLLAGYDPSDWSTGIYEINTSDPSASELYMSTPPFFGLISFPVACGKSRYFGLHSSNVSYTELIELDLVNKTVIGNTCVMQLEILDAASSTETGLDSKVAITGIQINKSCQSATGLVQISAVYPGSGNIAYTLDNTVTNTTGLFADVTAGQHSIRAASLNGMCSSDTSFSIEPAYNLIAGVTKTNPDNCANIPGNITITSSFVNGPVTYTLLNTGISQRSGNFSILRGGMYNFRLSNTAGCTTDTSIVLSENIPIGGCSDIFIPNAFTPNNDGKNDLFTINLPSTFKNVTLQVFNRWGNIVCQAKGNNISWDGSCNGRQQPVGIFIYTLKYLDPGGLQKDLKGTLTLLR